MAGVRVAVLSLVLAREWLVRRAGVAGCEPAALETESFPVCPPGPLLVWRCASWSMRVKRASLILRLRARSALLGFMPCASFFS